jgi:Fe-S-cluster-containing dehydrogenase component
MGITRRKFLGWMSVAAGATMATGKKAQAASNKQFKGYPGSYGVLHDTTRCIGCRKCEEACNSVNSLPPPEQPYTDLTVLDENRRTDAGTFTVVNRFSGNNGALPVYVKNQCNHCLEPACASACFVKALKKVPSGAVVYDESLCVGCRYCMIACPFNIPAYEYDEPLTPRVMKCDMCQPRLEKGLLPGCAESCPKAALTFGPREKLIEIARQRISKYPNRYVNHIYGEQEMGGTSWLYLSDHPFGEIGLREDLGVQAAQQFTAGPLSAVPIVVGLWPVLLLGIYAISKGRDKMAQQEKTDSVAKAIADANEEMEKKLAEMRDKMAKEKEAAINLEVKRALKDAAEKKELEEKGAEEGAADKPKEEK